jgi:intracellular septation protein A
MLVLDIAAPLIVVQAALRAAQSPVVALSIAALFPLADTLSGIVRSRRVSIIGAVSLAAILIGLGLAYVTGNALFAILKDSAFTLVFSLMFLGSLASSRPLIFRLYEQMVDAEARAVLDRTWKEQPGLRHAFRSMTLVWGVGLLLEAALRVLASFTLPVAAAASLSPWIAFICIGALIWWTVRFARTRGRAR